jgi:ribosomal protein L12E/L44/L45/RPP1/RPP2
MDQRPNHPFYENGEWSYSNSPAVASCVLSAVHVRAGREEGEKEEREKKKKRKEENKREKYGKKFQT